MKIRVEIKDTEPFAKEGTYIYDSGVISGLSVHHLLAEINGYLLRSLADLHELVVKG